MGAPKYRLFVGLEVKFKNSVCKPLFSKMDDSDNEANLQTREDSIDEDDAFSSLPPGSIKPSESSSTKKRKRSCGTKVNMLFACYHHTMLPSCKYCLLLRKFQNVSTFTYLRSARATHANTMKENTIIVHNATLSHTRKIARINTLMLTKKKKN